MVKKPTIKYLDRNGDYQYATVKDIGDIDELLTPIKTDLVSAINAIIEGGLGGGGGLSQEWIDYINGIGSDLEDVMNSIDAGIFSPAQLAEIQEAIDYARTEIERLLSIDYTEKFDQIREEYDEKVQEINNNVDGVTNNLEAARESLESVREHLSNVELNVTTVTESVDYVKGELSTKVDSTTFELLESTVNDNSTEILQNAEEIRLKASQDSLDLATQDIQQLQADFSVTAEAIEGTVKKSELVGELEGLDIYPPTLLRGSRDWWEWESTIPARAYVKSETYQHASIQEQVGFNAYLTKELTDLEIGKTYVASIWIKSEATHAKPVFKIGSTNHFMKNNNTSDEFLSNIWQRYSVSFVADKEIVIVGYTTTETVSGDIVQFAGGKVEIGTKSTGWREHEDDNHNRLVVAETTVRQTAEGIAQIAQRQTEIDGEIEEQQTQLNQTSEKIDLQADKLTQHGEDITEMSAQLTVQADMIKSKVSQTDINKSIGDIKLDNRNGILNSDFSQDFDNWSGISSVFKVVKIGNKNYAQASRTGLTGDVISTISSNMIQAKNGQRIMIGMDMIVENVNIYDAKIPFILDMFDINDVRVSHKYFTTQEMGVTFQDGVVRRVNANYEIDREDVAKVRLRLSLYRNGTVSYTNITLQRGDIGSTDWSPAPEDAQAITAKLSTEIIQTADKIEAKADKSIVDELTGDMSTMNATIEAQAEQIGLRVTKTEAQGYAKDAVDEFGEIIDGKIVALDAQIKIESDKITSLVTKVDGQEVYINEITQTAGQNAALIADHTGALSMISQKVDSIDLSVVRKDKIIAGINASTEKDGTGTLRLKGDRILIDGNTSFKSDLVMDGGIIRSKDNGINIDLNKGEMNLSKPLTINAKPVATKEDLSSLEQKYEGQSLLDKTEILSGTEVFTDRADDSVVHVEIDGNSVGGGSGKNIVLGLPYQSYSSNLAQGRVRVPVNFDSMKSNQGGKITFSFEARSSVSANASIYILDLSNYTSKGYHVNNIGIGVVGTEWKTYTVTGNINTNIILDNIAEFTLSHNSDNPHDTEVRNIQIEIGSVATAYEPPAPTPEYPIAINNLNDFDMVSSVGKENLALDSDFNNTPDGWSGANSPMVHSQGVLIINANGGNSVATRFEKYMFLDKGIYTITVRARASTPLQIKSFANANVIGSISSFSGNNEWVTSSASFEVLDSSKATILRVYLSDGSSGKIAEMDWYKIEKGEGTSYSESLNTIPYDTKSPTLYKTNILLSEPLRSVGDVKDRLFRDDDGLWKVERNVGEKIFTGGESFTTVQPTDNTMIRFTYTPLAPETRSGYNNVLSNYFKPNKEQRFGEVVEESIDTHPSSGTMEFFIKKARLSTNDSAGFKSWLGNNHVAVQYLRNKAIFETLPQDDQDKLNNIASYKDSNYLYTIVDKTNILPEYVRDNLKPTLHATFKGGGWYSRFKMEQGFNQTNKSVDDLKNETIPALKDGLLNSSEKEAVRQSLNVVSADKKGIDTQFTTVYANKALTGTAKTNLNSAKVALNTAFTNLQSAINAVLGVGDGTRITTAQMTLVTTRLNEYGTALSTYNQRYEQAQDAISTEKKRLADAYALAQAELAETEAKAYADGVVSAEEKRAIQDAKNKLTEAQNHAQGLVDGIEIGGTNLFMSHGIKSLPSYPSYNTHWDVVGNKISTTISINQTLNLTLNSSILSRRSSIEVYYTISGYIKVNGRIPTSNIFIDENINTQKGSVISFFYNPVNGYFSTTKFGQISSWFFHAHTTLSLGDILSIEKMKVEFGNKATDWTPAPEDVEESYKAVAKAEANLAETQAKAHADGKITAEEKRAIADAKAKLTEAQNHAQGLVDGIEVGGVNLINKGDIRSGRYINESTATLPPHVDYDTSGYLPVTPGREYIISAKMLYQVRVVYFDSSYSYISGILYSGNQGTSKIIVPPSNSSFVRMCGNKKSGSPLSTWMFEKGNKASTYKESPQDENRAGRNLLLDTSDFWEDYSVASGSFTTNVRRVEFSEMGLSVGDKFTVQVDLRCTNADNGVRLRVEQYKSGSDRISTYSQAEWLNYGVQRHVVTETVLADKPILNIYIAPEVTPVPSGTSVPFSVRRIMVEKGDVASAYSQAPEDIQEELDSKANQDDLSSVEGSLNDLYTVVNDLDVQTVKDQLAEYQEILSGVQSDSNEAKDQLERILSEENGALAIINTILNGFNERWTTLDGFIEINDSETALSINKGNTNMVIDSDSLTFYSGGSPVATITNQYMKIDRGIFVESMHIGRHQWAPLQSNKDHFVLSYVGDAPL